MVDTEFSKIYYMLSVLNEIVSENFPGGRVFTNPLKNHRLSISIVDGNRRLVSDFDYVLYSDVDSVGDHLAMRVRLNGFNNRTLFAIDYSDHETLKNGILDFIINAIRSELVVD